jgi:hypothetical protein
MYRRSSTLVLIVLPPVAACQSLDDQRTTMVNGVVETVDPNSRELLIRGGVAQTGARMSMIVGPQIQHLNETQPQDRSPRNRPTAWRAGDAGSRPTLVPTAGSWARRRVGAALPARLSIRRSILTCAKSNKCSGITAKNPKRAIRHPQPEVGGRADTAYE